jgi:hypothetical protein
MYPSTSLFIAIGQLAIAVLVMFSYPLQVHPCRNCLDKVFHFDSANDKLEDEAVADEHDAGEMKPLKHTLLTTAVVGAGFTIAYFVDNLEMGTVFFMVVHVPRANCAQYCPLWEPQDQRLFRSSYLDCSTGRQVLTSESSPVAETVRNS